VGASEPPGRIKIFRRNLQEKFVSAPRQSKGQFLGHIAGRGDVEGRSGSGLFSNCNCLRFEGDD